MVYEFIELIYLYSTIRKNEGGSFYTVHTNVHYHKL